MALVLAVVVVQIIVAFLEVMVVMADFTVAAEAVVLQLKGFLAEIRVQAEMAVMVLFVYYRGKEIKCIDTL
jgi:hypothetical protein